MLIGAPFIKILYVEGHWFMARDMNSGNIAVIKIVRGLLLVFFELH